jgi:hypothetical protein
MTLMGRNTVSSTDSATPICNADLQRRFATPNPELDQGYDDDDVLIAEHNITDQEYSELPMVKFKVSDVQVADRYFLPWTSFAVTPDLNYKLFVDLLLKTGDDSFILITSGMVVSIKCPGVFKFYGGGAYTYIGINWRTWVCVDNNRRITLFYFQTPVDPENDNGILDTTYDDYDDRGFVDLVQNCRLIDNALDGVDLGFDFRIDILDSYAPYDNL